MSFRCRLRSHSFGEMQLGPTEIVLAFIIVAGSARLRERRVRKRGDAWLDRSLSGIGRLQRRQTFVKLGFTPLEGVPDSKSQSHDNQDRSCDAQLQRWQPPLRRN